MNFEIVAFYPIERNDEKKFLRGTLHIFLVEHGIHVRGVYVFKKKAFCSIQLPYQTTLDRDEKVRYPILSFEPEKQAEFTKTIREKGREFVEEYLKNNPKQKEEKKTISTGNDNKKFENTSTKVASPPKIKVWRDVPPLKLRKR